MRAERIPGIERTCSAAGTDVTTEDWWGDIERDILDCLARNGALATAEIGRQLGFSEATASALVSLLASEGKVRISRVELIAPAAGALRAESGKAA